MDIQKESLQTPAALFHHLHKRSLVSLASVVMPCSGLIAATEFQAWLKEKKKYSPRYFWGTTSWQQEVSLHWTVCYEHPPKASFGGDVRNYWGWKGESQVYSHFTTPGHSPCNLETQSSVMAA